MSKDKSQEMLETMSSIGGMMQDHLRDQKLLENRTIFLAEGVTAASARKVIADLMILDGLGKEPINLLLNSPGGEVNSGLAIYDTIRYIESPVRIVTVGLCASIATIINSAVDKDHRYSLPNSRFLIHQPLIMGQIYGQASDLEITAKQILMTREKLNKILAEACGQEFSKLEHDTQRDYWMNAEESKEYGLIGKIISKVSELD